MLVLGDIAIAVVFSIAAFPLTLVLTRFFMKWNRSRGIIGVDAHKLSKPEIPEMCGISVTITMLLFALFYGSLRPEIWLKLLAFGLVVGSAGLVGAVDDRLKMRGIFKPALTLLCGLPILIIGYLYPNQVYESNLRVPIFGSFHLPIIYPLTILVAISVSSNTVNMLDPLNGTMSGGIAIVSLGILIGLILTNADAVIIFLYASLGFALLGFYYYNKFPARAFAGNVGQLSIGACVGALAILGRTEIASIVALFPNIQNSFFFLSKIRRFTEHRKLTVRPTKLLANGKLASSEEQQAPLTLVRTILVGRPAFENDIVHTIFTLYFISTSLAIITILLVAMSA